MCPEPDVHHDIPRLVHVAIGEREGRVVWSWIVCDSLSRGLEGMHQRGCAPRKTADSLVGFSVSCARTVGITLVRRVSLGQVLLGPGSL
jgi:hypothetical protein